MNASRNDSGCDLNGIRCHKYEIRKSLDRAEAWNPNNSIYELEYVTLGSEGIVS